MPTILRYARRSLLLILLILLLWVRFQPRDERVFPMDPALADRSLVTGQPCAPPCWYGLVPDVSTEEEVISTLQTLPFVAANTITVTQESNRFQDYDRVLRFACRYPGGSEQCGTASFSGNRLKELGISLQYPLTLETLVEHRGPPEYVTYFPVSPHCCDCFLSFVWPAEAVEAVRYDPNSDRACQRLREGQGLERQLLMDSVYYRAPDTFAALKAGFERPRVAWPGFLGQ